MALQCLRHITHANNSIAPSPINKMKLPLLALIALVSILSSGCDSGSTHSPDTSIRYRIIEVPKGIINSLIPENRRVAVEGSTYQIVTSSSAEIEELISHQLPDSGLLTDHQRNVNWWPKVADTWSYSRADHQLLGSGGGAGFLGVQIKDDSPEIRIDYDVTHSINTSDAVTSKLFYEGKVPPNRVLIAIKPFQRTDGTELFHIIVFEIEGLD